MKRLKHTEYRIRGISIIVHMHVNKCTCYCAVKLSIFIEIIMSRDTTTKIVGLQSITGMWNIVSIQYRLNIGSKYM